ncbi:hypothetical protein [Fredinandcohnia sp. 179-A 10B2 NHS]|uniref:hypothetical protein n=1 Tax=Fredinandcohnia sp. 179-A 10B2 NHS TaxID=3235176 RepID=UPI0039A15887
MDSYQKVTIAGSDHELYVKRDTHKGRHLMKYNGITNPKLTNLWRDAISQFQPDIVIDVGAQFGEVLFSTTYEKETKIIAFEMNPEYIPYLIKSKQNHPNFSQIEIIPTTSATLVSNQVVYEALPQLVPLEDKNYGRLLFNMRLDGFESFFLKRLKGVVDSCEQVVGYIEFNSIQLKENGVNIEEYIHYLEEHFTIFIHASTNKLIKLDSLNIPSLKRVVNKPYIITHLLLTTDSRLIETLGFHLKKAYLDMGFYYSKE